MSTSPVDACWNRESGSGCWSGSTSLPGVGSLTGGSSGQRHGTIMSYCHQLSGGISNIASTFGKNTNRGVVPSRVSNLMKARAAAVATANPSCMPIVGAGKPAITNPTPGSTLAGSSQAFRWTSNGVSVAEYWLYAGSSKGRSNYYSRSQGTNTSGTITGLPTNGSTVWVRLWWRTASDDWQYNDYSYKAATSVSWTENFTSTPRNWLQDAGTWDIRSSTYWHTAGRSGLSNTSTYNASYSNAGFSARIWKSANDPVANRLFVRASGSITSAGKPQNGYLFQTTRNGSFSVYKLIGGSATALRSWTASSAINKGSAWNELRAIANGTSLRFYINNRLVWSGSDSSLSSGRVGVGTYSTGDFWVDWAKYSTPSSMSAMDEAEVVEETTEVGTALSGGTVDQSPE